MAFKMKGPSMHMGTASYKKAHEAAATKKAAPYNSGHDKTMTNERWSEMSDATTKRTGKSLNDLVAARKNYEKGSKEYNAIQNEINKSYGVSKRHEQAKKTTATVGGEKMVIKKKGDGDDTKIKTGSSKIAGGSGKTVIKTKGGESEQTRGPKASTGNKETKAKASSGKGNKGDDIRTVDTYDEYGNKTGTKKHNLTQSRAKDYRKAEAKGGKGSKLAGRIAGRLEKSKDDKKTEKLETRLTKRTQEKGLQKSRSKRR